MFLPTRAIMMEDSFMFLFFKFRCPLPAYPFFPPQKRWTGWQIHVTPVRKAVGKSGTTPVVFFFVLHSNGLTQKPGAHEASAHQRSSPWKEEPTPRTVSHKEECSIENWTSWVWCFKPVIPALSRQTQGDLLVPGQPALHRDPFSSREKDSWDGLGLETVLITNWRMS